MTEEDNPPANGRVGSCFLMQQAVLQVTFDKQRDLATITPQGKVELGEVLTELPKFYTQTRATNIIWDLREAHISCIPVQEMLLIVAYIQRYSGNRPGGKSAVVAPDDGEYALSILAEELGRTASLLWQIAGFCSMEEAQVWIAKE